MIKILFQGDSITDAQRTRENENYLGSGYANIVSAKLGYDFPGEYKFINKGINGNRITDLYLRIRKDILDIAPDYLSILIGVNDVWHELEVNDGVSAEKFEKIYDLLLSEVKESLPNIKFIIMEPFILKGTATCPDKKTWKYFESELELRRNVCKKMAEKYNAIYVSLQEKFNEAQLNVKDLSYYLRDGVHPTASGSELIAREWIKEFLKKI